MQGRAFAVKGPNVPVAGDEVRVGAAQSTQCSRPHDVRAQQMRLGIGSARAHHPGWREPYPPLDTAGHSKTHQPSPTGRADTNPTRGFRPVRGYGNLID
ncbi:hypothetical protein GCM10027610_082440 [Dactylosporangium cerinum]